MSVMNSKIPRGASAALTIGLWLLIAAALFRIAAGEQYQWDLRVFHAAPAALENGENPYDNTAPGVNIPSTLSYLYPPIVLYVFKPLADLSYSAAHLAWFAIKILALVSLLVLWHRHFERLGGSWPIVLFFLFAFKSTLLRDITAGNIAILEQLGLWTGFYLILKRRPYMAGAILALTAQVKLMPVVFLGLLLICGPTRGWKPFLTSLAIFAGLFSLNYVFMPEMSNHYLQSFASNNPNLDERGEINPCSLAMLRDVAAVISDFGIPMSPSLVNALYFLYAGVFGCAILFVLFKYEDQLRSVDSKLLMYVACVLFALIMPRVKDYTYIILLIPALFVLRRIDVRPLVPVLGILVFLPPTDSYVPGLGNAFISWLQSYMPWIIAWVLLYYLAREIWRAGTARRSDQGAPEPTRDIAMALQQDDASKRGPLAEPRVRTGTRALRSV